MLPRFECEMELLDFIDNDGGAHNHTPLMIRDRVCSQDSGENELEGILFNLEVS